MVINSKLLNPAYPKILDQRGDNKPTDGETWVGELRPSDAPDDHIFTGPIAPRSSGSPVYTLDPQGQLVFLGVVSSGSNIAFWQENEVILGIPYPELLDFLSDMIQYILDNPIPPPAGHGASVSRT